MNIILYTGFAKKRNSTKVPPENATKITLTGTLKEPCSVMAPVFQIKRGAVDAVPDPYTYAYIAVFGRYYFVTNVTWQEGLWEIQLEVDVLASYRTQIGTGSHYILRTNSTGTDFDPLITDTMYPATNDYQTDHTVMLNSDFAASISQGCYVVGIISKDDTNSVGAITYYAMTSAEFGALKEALLSDDNLETMQLTASGVWNISDMSQQLFKTMYNPYQYIASCMWFPIDKSDLTYSTDVGIPIGWWTYSSLTASKIYAQTVSFLSSETAIVPAHPQAATRGDYLNYGPYTKISLYGRFGTLPLDPSYTKEGWTIAISYYIDIITGMARAFITTYDASAVTPNTVVLAERVFQIGVPIQLAQVGVDYLGTSLAAVDAVAGTVTAATRFDVGGMISSAAHGIYNTLQSSMPQLATSGANGSFLTPFTITHIQFQHYKIADEDISHKGRPLCQIRTINTLTGYILCADGEFDLSCLAEERSMIEEFLTTGFFWE